MAINLMVCDEIIKTACTKDKRYHVMREAVIAAPREIPTTLPMNCARNKK